MKIMQIVNNLVHADFSSWGTVEQIPEGTFPQELMNQLVEAPDHVFVGWGYVDETFIKPTPPEGFEYDDATGTFYPTGTNVLAQIQQQTYGKTYDAVVDGTITPETFELITGEAFIQQI